METDRIRSTGEALSESAELTDLSHFVVRYNVLPVGKRASSAHSHSHQEEFFFVLVGTPTLWTDGKSENLKPGDYVSLAAGTEAKHFLKNDGPEEVCYLSVASKSPEDVVGYW